MNLLHLFTVSIIFCVSVAGYSKSPSAPETQAYILPNDTQKLWVSDGNLDSKTVLLICQGGPKNELNIVKQGRTLYRYLPDYKTYEIAYLHQAQTLFPEVFQLGNDLSVQTATQLTDLTAEILARSIRYYKEKDKQVVVLGHSYGAFVVAHYLANFPSEADQYFLSAGRLDVQQVMVNDHLKGVSSEFAKDGKTYLPFTGKDFSDYSTEERKAYYVKNMLKGAIGIHRYTQLLEPKNLANLSYFYATNDTHVGAMTEHELLFLKTKGVSIFPNSDGHSDTLKRMIDAFYDGKVSLEK